MYGFFFFPVYVYNFPFCMINDTMFVFRFYILCSGGGTHPHEAPDKRTESPNQQAMLDREGTEDTGESEGDVNSDLDLSA